MAGQNAALFLCFRLYDDVLSVPLFLHEMWKMAGFSLR